MSTLFLRDALSIIFSNALANLMIRLSTLTYPIKQESLDISKKTPLMNYQSFAKQADISFTLSGGRSPGGLGTTQRQDSIQPFLLDNMSPINRTLRSQSQREGIYIQDNSGVTTPNMVLFLIYGG